jgi:hypothetical protein
MRRLSSPIRNSSRATPPSRAQTASTPVPFHVAEGGGHRRTRPRLLWPSLDVGFERLSALAGRRRSGPLPRPWGAVPPRRYSSSGTTSTLPPPTWVWSPPPACCPILGCSPTQGGDTAFLSQGNFCIDSLRRGVRRGAARFAAHRRGAAGLPRPGCAAAGADAIVASTGRGTTWSGLGGPSLPVGPVWESLAVTGAPDANERRSSTPAPPPLVARVRRSCDRPMVGVGSRF